MILARPPKQLRALLTAACLGMLSLSAQPVYISRLIPGNPAQPGDPAHRIELFNESPDQIRLLSGYWIMTRSYAVMLGPDAAVSPLTAYRIGWNAAGVYLDLELSRAAQLRARRQDGQEEGDFVALFDPQGGLVDAFYYGRRPFAGFLPAEETMDSGVRLLAPDEGDPRWGFIQAAADPAMAFVQVGGKWRINSRTRNLIPATEFQPLQAQHVDGIVTIHWTTSHESDCYYFTVERSDDGKNYKSLARVRAHGAQTPYTYYDTSVERDRVYYYRVVHIDKFGNAVSSPPAKSRTDELPAGFTFDIIQGDRGSGESLNVRFSSREAQQIQIQLLDEDLREVAVLFYGQVQPEKQNLVAYHQPMGVGKYFVIVAAGGRRYFEPVIVE
ncbi:MAG: hypothetical protein NW241_00550 [Bacteroidia bacterium]|nr:hypothetical protein [Bacteroidia bacterium]